MHQTISWGCHNGKEPRIKIGGWDGAAEGQQRPEPGHLQPEAAEDITVACGEISGEGVGQDLDPLASFQSGWAVGLCFCCLHRGQFGGGRVRGSSICLWLRLPSAFRGLLVVVVVGLGRGYTLQDPSFEEPPGRQEGEARERAQTLSLLPGGSAHHTSIQPGPTVPLALERGLGGAGESGSALSLEGEGSLLLPLSGSASASEGWYFPWH